jgi:hypothetical protein
MVIRTDLAMVSATDKRRKGRSFLISVFFIYVIAFSLCFNSVAVIALPLFRPKPQPILERPFIGTRPIPSQPAAGGGDDLLEDAKRQIPSCPDPLHNR